MPEKQFTGMHFKNNDFNHKPFGSTNGLVKLKQLGKLLPNASVGKIA